MLRDFWRWCYSKDSFLWTRPVLTHSTIEKTIDPSWSMYGASLITVLQVAEQFGVSSQMLLDEVGIEAEELNIPDRRFPVNRYFRLLQLAATAADNPDIGLSLGRVGFLKGLNLQLYMATVCRSLKDYLNLIPSVLKLRGDLGQMTAHRNLDLIELRWEPLLPETGARRFLSDEMLSASASIISSLCVLPVNVLKANLSYAQPNDLSVLQETFGTNLSFEQPYSSLFFTSEALNYPMLQQDYQEGPDHRHPFRDFFVDDDPSDQLLSSLKQSIAQYLPEGEVTIDKLARKLNVSRRTLQRRLSDRDTNFLNVLQEVRSRVSQRYLLDNRLAITEIAFLLGYADQGSFSSAFKSWHGVSPREYRRS